MIGRNHCRWFKRRLHALEDAQRQCVASYSELEEAARLPDFTLQPDEEEYAAARMKRATAILAAIREGNDIIIKEGNDAVIKQQS
jgi:hypothetical protein